MKKKQIRYLTRKRTSAVARLMAIALCLPQLPVTVYANDNPEVIEIAQEETAGEENTAKDVIIIDDIGTVKLDDEDAYDVIYEEDTGESIYYEEASEDVIYEGPEDSEEETDVIVAEPDVIEEEPETIFTDNPELIPIGNGATVIVETEDEEESIFEETKSTGNYNATSQEVTTLAQLIHHEAGNQPRAGKVAVGEVVMNRVNSSHFSQNNITDVIYAPGQFSYNNELVNMHPTEEEYEIAAGVIDGTERVFNDPDVLFFKNPTITSSGRYDADDVVDWGRYEWYAYIGGHAFYKYPS